MNISIDKKLKEKCPNIALGCIFADVIVSDREAELDDIIESFLVQFEKNYKDIQLSTLDEISAGRQTYRALGKDPTKYRVSSEALARRVVKGKGLYKINNVVDVNNLISLTTLYPVCSYDVDQLKGDIVMTYEDEIDSYEGISRGILNVAKMPILVDDLGIFGSTTSDSERAKITTETKRLFMKVVAFDGTHKLEASLNSAKELLIEFCNAENVETLIIE